MSDTQPDQKTVNDTVPTDPAKPFVPTRKRSQTEEPGEHLGTD